MSTSATQRAFEQDVYSGTRAQVLTYLCWRANEDGIAWPKRSTIAGAVNVSEKQVKRHVQALEKRGHLWYQPGRGRGNASMYVPTIGLQKKSVFRALLNAGLQKGDAQEEADEILSRRKGDPPDEKGDTDDQKGDGEGGVLSDEKGDTQGRKGDTEGKTPPSDAPFSKKGTPEKRGHPWGEKGTCEWGFFSPPNDNISNPPKRIDNDKQNTQQEERSEREAEDAWRFLPEPERVYLDTIRDSIEEFSVTSGDRLVRRHWGGYKQGQLPKRDLARLLKKQQDKHGDGEGFRRFVAAVVVTANEANQPGLKYLKSVLDTFDRSRTQQNGHDDKADDKSASGWTDEELEAIAER
jgi:hypothetical protein